MMRLPCSSSAQQTSYIVSISWLISKPVCGGGALAGARDPAIVGGNE
jgi:hypothetical protein